MAKPTLNLGCGTDKWGDVRVDIVKTKTTTMLLDFDKEDLPFPDKSFSECRLFHVLEHSKNPQRLLNESLRVSDRVHARFPYRWDRIPFVLHTPFHWRGSWGDVFDHNLSILLGRDHPLRHRWMIQPFGTYHVNKLALLGGFFRHGRKARYLRNVPLLDLWAEWDCSLPAAEPSVDILIVKYGNDEQLRDCLDSIKAFTDVPHRILVHDNTDRNLGFSKAVNRLIRQSISPYLVLLNPDTLVTPGWIVPLLKSLHGNIGIVQPRMVRFDGSIDSTGHIWSSRKLVPFTSDRRTEGELDLRSACFGAVVLRRDMVQQVGLLDERFFLYYEDVDYCLRAKKYGWKIKYCPDSTVLHYRHGTTPDHRPNDIEGRKSYMMLLRKHFFSRYLLKRYLYPFWMRMRK